LLYGCYILGYDGDPEIAGTPSDLVGVAGFEPTAPRSQSECATKLRHTPCTGEPSGFRHRRRRHARPGGFGRGGIRQEVTRAIRGMARLGAELGCGMSPVRHAGVAQW
jgi:hypothetical protein